MRRLAIIFLVVLAGCHVHLVTIETPQKPPGGVFTVPGRPTETATGATTPTTTQPQQVRPTNLDSFLEAVRDSNH